MNSTAKSSPQGARGRLPTTQAAGLSIGMNQLLVGRVRQCPHILSTELGGNGSLLNGARLHILLGAAGLSHQGGLKERG
jgi:hypothetical protein